MTRFTILALALSLASPVLADDLVARGEYIATASDCTACHSGAAGAMAGGHRIESPVGAIVASNITPSDDFGIGRYTEAQFADAVRKGIRADGARLYPAMPYTAYSLLTDDDIHALYAYFQQGVAPVDVPTEKTQLPFPMNMRFSMIGWNLLFRNDAPFQTDPSQSDAWNRGRYLAEGPGHCSTCHTPRGLLMQEIGSQHLAGAQVGAWYAPNITSDAQAGIGAWDKAEIVAYLKTGHAEGKAQAGGSMAEAVEKSFSHLTDADLDAIATYVATVPAVANGPSRVGQGRAGNTLTAVRGDGYAEGLRNDEGTQLYSANCAACHGADGQGTGDGYYPSLYDNTVTVGQAKTNLVAAILYGVDRETEAGHVFMPPFGTQPNAVTHLDDAQIATLANHVATLYGDGQADITPETVAQIRAGGPSSPLLMQVRVAMAVGGAVAIIVLLCLALWWRRRKV